MADFDNEDEVLAEVANALGASPDEDLTIEQDRGLESFGAGTVYRIEWGREEYVVVEDYDQMRELAIKVVTQDLEEEPEIFTQSWLEQHINMDRLRRDLSYDVQNMTEEDLRHMSDSEFWRQASQYGVEPGYIVHWDTPDDDGVLPHEYEDEDEAEKAGEAWKERAWAAADQEEYDEDAFEYWVEEAEPSDDQVSEVAEAITEDQLRDPMRYLEDIYGDEATKRAIEIAGIDVKAAAEDAVDTDGPEHFLARYDGNYEETDSDFIYWRDN